MISVHFHGKPFNITVIQVYAPTSNTEEADVELFYEDLQGFLELTPPQKDGAMLSKSLILFFVDGWGCVPSLLFTWGQTMVEIIKIMVTSLFQKIPCMYSYTQCPQPFSRPPPTHTSARDSWTLMASLGQSLVGSLLLSPGSCCAQVSVCTL